MGFFSKVAFWNKKQSASANAHGTADKDPAVQDPGASPAKTAKTAGYARYARYAGQDSHQQPGWEQELTLALREATPRLSVWLSLVTDKVEKAGPVLWQRLEFLLRSLEVPPQEAQQFTADFSAWLEMMEYEAVSDFQSELQYRLALALDMEDEEEERSRFLAQLAQGLAKTRQKLSLQIDSLLAGHDSTSDAFWEELEELFIMADVGVDATAELIRRLQKRAGNTPVKESTAFAAHFKEQLCLECNDILSVPRRITAINPPEVILMTGVNGAGKTTTIAKLTYRAVMQGKKVLIAAGDTFRAAAMEQLQVWAERTGAGFVGKGAGADPAAVAFEAMETALRDGYDMVIVDTAGRLHTKVGLMDELRKIKNVLAKKHPGAPHRCILVLDAGTGQNALSQVQLFTEAVEVNELILTKLDGTAKGGIVLALALSYDIPVSFVGLGEKMEDLRPFQGKDFALALLGEEGSMPDQQATG